MLLLVLTDAATVRRFFDGLPDEGDEPEPDLAQQQAVVEQSRLQGLPRGAAP